MRNRFDRQLEQLHDEMIKMCAMCECVISKASKCLEKREEKLIIEIFEIDKQIDEMEREIENLCMRLLLQQQPVAGDLRTVSSALKMISDMERIGDQASDIAEILKHIETVDVKSKVHINDMAKATIKMVSDSTMSFVNNDLDGARQVVGDDDIVDDLFVKVKQEITELLRTGEQSGEFCLDLLMIAKYFERIGDHATNIAEWVIYSIIGKHK